MRFWLLKWPKNPLKAIMSQLFKIFFSDSAMNLVVACVSLFSNLDLVLFKPLEGTQAFYIDSSLKSKCDRGNILKY